MKNKIFIITVFSMFTLACGMPKKSDLEFADSETSLINPDEEVTFAMVKSKILAPKCLSCHSDVGTEAGLSDWITPGKPDSSPFFTKSENGSMPKNGSPLSTAELELISVYITQKGSSPKPTPSPTPGPKPTPTPTPSPDPGTNPGITYEEVKDRILTEYRCTSCHSVGTEAKLAKWINKTSPSKSRLYTTTKSGSMPQGGSDVTAADQEFILQYLKDYAARN